MLTAFAIAWLASTCASGCASLRREDPLAALDRTQQRLTQVNRYPVKQASLEQPKASGPKMPELPDWSPNTLAKSVKEAAGYGTKPDEAKRLFAEADELYRGAASSTSDDRQKSFVQAGEKFVAAAKWWPDSALEEDAMFMAGESFFFADNYPKANDRYEKLLKKYPNSRYLDRLEAKRFAIAQHWLQRHESKPEQFYEFNFLDKSRPTRDTHGHALRVFDRIRFDDPTGRLADDATLALGHAAFRKGDYVKADEYYTDLRTTFPASEHAFDAHFIGLKAKLLSYRGPDYDGHLLEESQQLVTQMKRQFPEKAAEQHEYLARSAAEVRFRKAERLWSRVTYHRMRSEYGSARFYAQQLLDEFSDTPFKDRARDLMVDTQGKPATPPQQLSWLVNMFPESDRTKPLLRTDTNSTKRR